MIVASDSIDVLPPWKFLLYMALPVTFSFFLSTWYIQYCWVSAREQEELEENHHGIYMRACLPGFKILSRFPMSKHKNSRKHGTNNDLSDDEEAAYKVATAKVPGTPSKSPRSRSNSRNTTPRSNSNNSHDVIESQPRVTAYICGKEAMELPAALSPTHPSHLNGSKNKNKFGLDTLYLTDDETVVQKISRVVTSPYPYILIILVAIMIIMIFVDIMAISGLIVVSAVVMVMTVVLGNHWRNSAVWKVDTTNNSASSLVFENEEEEKEHSPIVELSQTERDRQLEEFFETMFNSIDYNLLFIFGGLFVVVANIENTGAPKYIWDMIAGNNAFQSASSITGICIFVAFASQFLGNVAVCQLAKPRIEPLDDDLRRVAWALVSFVSTIAGNLTLTGSAANLIVAEQAMRIDRENTLDFWRHIKVCFWVCVISCTVGSFLILMAEAIN
jgi:ABC-type multidrug transport system fused ATPase/permease subunit